MKRLITILLALTIMVSLCACGSTPNPPSNDNIPTNTPLATEAPTTEPPVIAKDININGATTIGDVAEIKIVNAYTTKDVMPPKPSSFYTHYEASAGNVYFVIVMDIKNTGTSSVSADDIISAALVQNNSAYGATVVVEAEEGASLDSGYSTSIQALDTARVYQMFSVPENSDMNKFELVIENGGDIYRCNLSLNSFEQKIEQVNVGSVITDDDTISLTIDSIQFKNSLYPPKASGYYHYYEAANGKTYLIVKMTVKNLKGTDMKYDSIAGVSCVYNEKYNYSFFTVLEEDGGADLNSYPSQYSIAPLDSGVVYYLAEVPAEVANGSVEITFYIAGNYYKCSI